MTSHLKRLLAPAAAVAAMLALSGCVAYPAGYGYGYAPGYYEPGVAVAVPVYGGWGGGGWRGGGWGHGWRGR